MATPAQQPVQLTGVTTHRAGGIDVAGDRVHVVVLDERRCVATAGVHDAGDADRVAAELAAAGVVRVGIDSPDAASTGHHRDESELSAKFRGARCGEIALGRTHRIWVSWATPQFPPFPRWMEVGFALFASVRRAGIDAVEVYPHAAYRVLAGGRVPSKQTRAGLATRIALLDEAGIKGVPFLEMWSHDGLDAAAAALVAADPNARRITCDHDGSAIWIPGVRSVP